MVEVIYDGNLGNKLFQYCFGRILAEKLGYKLFAKPIEGFPGTYKEVNGQVHPAGLALTLRGQKPDLTFVNDTTVKYHILLTGYFQRYEYYEHYAQGIKTWLAIEDNISSDVGVNDVVLGIRRGNDYIPRHGLPISYYEDALSSMQYDRVFICTNEPSDPFVRHLQKKYSAKVRSPRALDNLIFIKKFKKIVISNSTFLWWAVFLSDAQEIIFPRPANGFWSSGDPMSKNISLEVGEPRYKYLACEKYKSEFVSEKVRIYSDKLASGTKAAMKELFPFLKRSKCETKSAISFSESSND